MKARQKNSDFFPNGQYFVNPSMAVKGMVIHSNKSEVANKPIRIFRADVLSFFDLNKEATTRLFPMAATKTTIVYRQMLTVGPDHVYTDLQLLMGPPTKYSMLLVKLKYSTNFNSHHTSNRFKYICNLK